jgi:hypothetical protein
LFLSSLIVRGAPNSHTSVPWPNHMIAKSNWQLLTASTSFLSLCIIKWHDRIQVMLHLLSSRLQTCSRRHNVNINKYSHDVCKNGSCFSCRQRPSLLICTVAPARQPVDVSTELAKRGSLACLLEAAVQLRAASVQPLQGPSQAVFGQTGTGTLLTAKVSHCPCFLYLWARNAVPCWACDIWHSLALFLSRARSSPDRIGNHSTIPKNHLNMAPTGL